MDKKDLQMAKFNIIIPTYQHLFDCLVPCVDSIIKHTILDYCEIIIVANRCTDGTRDYVNGLGSPFKLLWFDEPAGFTRAVNAGIEAAQGEYIVILNNDLELLGSDWLSMLYAPFENDSTVG